MYRYCPNCRDFKNSEERCEDCGTALLLLTESAKNCPSCGAKNRISMEKCYNCGYVFDVDTDIVKVSVDKQKGIEKTKEKIEMLTPEWAVDIENKLKDLEFKFKTLKSTLPQSDIINPSFWRRAWTVFGYSLATAAVVYGIILVIVLFVTVIGSLGR